MKKLKMMFMVALVAVLSMTFVSEDVLARGGSRSSSRSSSSRSSSSRSRSYSKPAPRKTYSKPAPRKTVTRKATPSKAKSSRVASKTKMSPAKQKSLETAKKNGTSFKSKSAATAAFKTKQAGKYPSKYATKPATRPSHIPQSTMVGGRSVNISYNNGGYGYTNGMGTWMAYSMMSDAIMMNTMMNRSNYIVHNPVAQSYRTPVVVHRTGPSIGTVLVWVFVIIIGIVVFAVVVVPILSGNSNSDD
jgi:hypothetical protein